MALLPADRRRHRASRSPAGSVLVEYGASDEAKAAYLLDAQDDTTDCPLAAYVPIDVAAPALVRMLRRLGARVPTCRASDRGRFPAPVALPPALAGLTRLGFFPGSTIGNLEPAVGRCASSSGTRSHSAAVRCS